MRTPKNTEVILMNVSRETNTNIYYLLVVCKMSERKVKYNSKTHKFEIELPVDRIEIKRYNYGVEIITDVNHTISFICDKWCYKGDVKTVCISVYKTITDISQLLSIARCAEYCIDINADEICKKVDCYLSRQKYLKRGLY